MRTSYNRKLFDFIIFSNIFIAFCATIMAGYSTHQFSLGWPHGNFIGFIFFSTLASYSIHWYLTDAETEITDSRTFWLTQFKWIHAVFFITSSIGCAYFLFLELHYIKWILPTILLTFLYSAPKFFPSLKKLIFGKTVLLALMWTYVTSTLPLLIADRPWQFSYTLFSINRFLLIFPICILFDLRDKDYDKATGVKSLVTALSLKNIKKIFNLTIILNVVTIPVISYYAEISIVDNFILLIPTVLTFFLFSNAVKTKNDYLFYFILDGLMALSPMLYFMKTLLFGTIFA